MGKRLLKPEVGNVFAVPLPDGRGSIGQVIAVLNDAGAVACALFPVSVEMGQSVPELPQPILVQVITPDLLARGYWPVLETREVRVPSSLFHWEDYREAGWVGLKIIGSGIIREFVAAYYGFAPWNMMADPEFFTKLLIEGAERPTAAYSAGG